MNITVKTTIAKSFFEELERNNLNAYFTYYIKNLNPKKRFVTIQMSKVENPSILFTKIYLQMKNQGWLEMKDCFTRTTEVKETDFELFDEVSKILFDVLAPTGEFRLQREEFRSEDISTFFL